MAEIVKFFYVLFLFISTPFIIKKPGSPNLRNHSCLRDKDCPQLKFHNIRCRNGFCVDIR
ncbi:putative Late nodulin [Medicago truncatula]|uniref:Nodule Cysteine-Rich (NCR) secreted peptide n=1 Tax=Medicago truncatula TaxID=3880 RepID=A0A072TZ06_MEDTR|nr:Nodule Cysteine-Rich (NCR) secreted peptide [Medicago truncatula]RHN45567.1 putative Late nodulin [Medicago truncatula]